jgi:putative iron-dependent peroxidase
VRALSQPGILAPVPKAGRYLSFALAPPSAARCASPSAESVTRAVANLSPLVQSGQLVVGLGPDTLALCGKRGSAPLPGMRMFPALAGPAVVVPSTPVSLWCWLRGEDAGDLLHLGRTIGRQLAPVFVLQDVVDAFRHGRGPKGFGLDLSGYEDGIENPVRAAARAAALLRGQGPGLDGSSCASVQQWVHDFSALEAMSEPARDAMYGRRRTDSEEMDDAPVSAHVKRTAQESFSPEAFVVRRSMPWSSGRAAGLMFVAFGSSVDAFEAQLRRMVGLEDGVTDALFGMSRPVTGCHAWCPPMDGDALDLRVLLA